MEDFSDSKNCGHFSAAASSVIRPASLPVCFLPDHWLPTILGSDEWGPEERGRSQYIVGQEEEQPTTAVHWRDELEHWSLHPMENEDQTLVTKGTSRVLRRSSHHWRVKT